MTKFPRCYHQKIRWIPKILRLFSNFLSVRQTRWRWTWINEDCLFLFFTDYLFGRPIPKEQLVVHLGKIPHSSNLHPDSIDWYHCDRLPPDQFRGQKPQKSTEKIVRYLEVRRFNVFMFHQAAILVFIIEALIVSDFQLRSSLNSLLDSINRWCYCILSPSKNLELLVDRSEHNNPVGLEE